MRIFSILMLSSFLAACATPHSVDLEANAAEAIHVPNLQNQEELEKIPAHDNLTQTKASVDQAVTQTVSLNGAAQAAVPYTISNQAKGPYEQMMICSDGQEKYRLLLQKEGSLQASGIESGGPTVTGTYQVQGGKVNLNIPSLNFQESSIQVNQVDNILIEMRTPRLGCYVSAHAQGPAADAYFKCPDIRYIPGTSYQTNAFQIYSEGHVVKRRRWNEFLGGVSDTLYSEIWGVYYMMGNKFVMYFGNTEEDAVLTGHVLANGGISIDQLEPQKGACTAS